MFNKGDILSIQCKMSFRGPKSMKKVSGLSLIFIDFYVSVLTPRLNSTETSLQLSENMTLFAVWNWLTFSNLTGRKHVPNMAQLHLAICPMVSVLNKIFKMCVLSLRLFVLWLLWQLRAKDWGTCYMAYLLITASSNTCTSIISFFCNYVFFFLQDVAKLTALSPEVISRQATINIGKNWDWVFVRNKQKKRTEIIFFLGCKLNTKLL
jgi:hypothetical protein